MQPNRYLACALGFAIVLALFFSFVTLPSEQLEVQEEPFFVAPYLGITETEKVVNDGLVLTPNSPREIKKFETWGTSGNTHIDVQTLSLGGFNFTYARGETNQSAGLVLRNLTHSEPLVSILIGNVTKSRDAQISISIQMQGKQGTYSYFLVHGPLFVSGWRDRIYYVKTTSFSSHLLNASALLASKNDIFQSITSITVVVQPKVQFEFVFRVDLSGNTLNLPGRVPIGSWIYGNTTIAMHAEKVAVVYHGTKLWLYGEFSANSRNLVRNESLIPYENGWTILSVSPDRPSMTGEKPLEGWIGNPLVMQHLDLNLTIQRFEKIDLFSTVLFVWVAFWIARWRQ